jgi:hypothetical protein
MFEQSSTLTSLNDIGMSKQDFQSLLTNYFIGIPSLPDSYYEVAQLPSFMYLAFHMCSNPTHTQGTNTVRILLLSVLKYASVDNGK